ncbi:DUF6193 family natural product biosynthesis protein [Kutzneria sp. NPDC051319]|uniref:DUF6193 family natural product biosynthesis protein n=1 Tax=Kutzneria sp. NPDC051319 TaxID=3155047 RepID=UPI003449EE3E
MIDVDGLRAALEHTCPDGEIEAWDNPGGPKVEVRRGERAASVFWHREKSVFWVSYRLSRGFMNRAARTDLAEVTGSAATWLGGATAREFAVVWPFADFVDVADAYESGDRIEYCWQLFRAHPRFGLDQFIDAAMREPRLRQMFPFTSMWWMSFRPTAEEFRVPGPWVRAADNGRYTIVENRPVETDIDYSPAEAVQVFVTEMDRLGVPRPEDLRSPSEHRPPAEAGG